MSNFPPHYPDLNIIQPAVVLHLWICLTHRPKFWQIADQAVIILVLLENIKAMEPLMLLN